MKPPKPKPRMGRVSLWRYWKLFREDILSAQPDHLYRAKMAEFRTPFFRSYLVNEANLVRRVLIERPDKFPKSDRVTRGLRPLLGRSVFVTNGAEWARQRRIIDPAFENRLKESFPHMLGAAEAATDRVQQGVIDVEEMCSHATADVIFRTLFSRTIEDDTAALTYRAFRTFQRAQPVATGAALVPFAPVWLPAPARRSARQLRTLVRRLVSDHRKELTAGGSVNDLAAAIMTTVDPESGVPFTEEEMVDQVAIFFLAGHETSASLLGWALWCLAAAPEWGDQVAVEAKRFMEAPSFSRLSGMPITRDVLRETLRLYPPVPMFVRETTEGDVFRKRKIRPGAQVVISPWHLGRHEAKWENPDVFDPGRWTQTKPAREAWLPFSAGPRVCPGAGFAMAEATILLGALMARYKFKTLEPPIPVAHLTVRARNGISLEVSAR